MAQRKKNQRKVDKDDLLLDVVEVRDSYQGWIENNKTKFLSIVGALFLIVGGYFIYKYGIVGPKEKAASMAIYKAENQFARDSFALALENPGGGFEGFLDVIDNYKGTKTSNLAKYYAGISYLNLGRYDDAISYLNSYKPSGDITPIMKYGAMADAYSEKNEFDKAIDLYGKAANAEDNSFLTPYYLKKLGLLQEKQGNNSAALSAFKQIKDKYASSSQGAEIDRFIAKLQ